MAAGARRRKKKHGGHEDGHPDERWLLTYADMITLLMALFMVLFSISSVNVSKFKDLQKSLADAFSGRAAPGGQGIAEAGGPTSSKRALAPPLAALPTPQKTGVGAAKSHGQEDSEFKAIKAKVDKYAQQHGLSGQVKTVVAKDGLHIRLLTDKLLFDSGSATVKAQSAGLLADLGGVLHTDSTHTIEVSGHTDNVPERTAQYPTNWELSTARASSVVRVLAGDGVNPGRLTAAGRADMDPVTSNDTSVGRAVNRRVEILLPRLAP